MAEEYDSLILDFHFEGDVIVKGKLHFCHYIELFQERHQFPFSFFRRVGSLVLLDVRVSLRFLNPAFGGLPCHLKKNRFDEAEGRVYLGKKMAFSGSCFGQMIVIPIISYF